MKKIGTAAGLAAIAIVAAVLSGAALANGTHGSTKPESASSGSNQSEPAAKIYICHATGSASNPYVLIHVSSRALPAHTGHQDGRDIVLGSSPGACPQPAPTADVKAAEHTQTQTAPTVTSQEPSNNVAPAPQTNEPADNDAAEASEQGEASDQNESATDEDKSASEQGEASDQNESGKDEGQSNSEQHAQSHDASDSNGEQHASDQSGD